MRACLFGTYNRKHTANLIYAAAVRAAGYELIEIHEPLWEARRGKDAAYFSPTRLIAHGLAWLRAAARLAHRWHTSGGASVAVIGFNGQLDVVLLRLLALRYGPRLIFAPLVSLTETLVEDRGVYRRGSLAARLLRLLDRQTCRLADVVVVDSQAHRRYFAEELGVDGSRLVVCHLGVDNAAFGAHDGCGPEVTADGRLEVLYFGEYLPLHGLDVVVDAVGRLSTRQDLRFTFIGNGEHRGHYERLLRATRARIEFIDWIPYAQLGARIAQADIVLGVFGTSVKAHMVIANKVWEAAAEGRPVVTLDCAAVREVFSDGRDILLAPADGAALAAAIRRLAEDDALRVRLGDAARETIATRFNDAALGLAWSGPLGGPGALPAEHSARTGQDLEMHDAEPLVGVAIVNYNDADSTLRCLASLQDCDYDNLQALVVDNGSHRDELHKLEGGMSGRGLGELHKLERNSGYTGANNLAMATLFARGCRYVLVLNNDTLVTPDSISMLVRCARRHPGAGPIGPRVARDWPGAKPASLGERYWPTLAWLPRSLLRVRRPRQRSYAVRGVLGCAMLVSRELWERVGGFDDEYFAYYDEVEYCLRARAAGMKARVEPMSEIAHRGHRGFGSGLSRVAAYLKARNLWRLGRREASLLGWPAFVAGYFLMIGVSMAGYLLRGQPRIVAAMAAGVAAGLRDLEGRPPPVVFDAAQPPTVPGAAPR